MHFWKLKTMVFEFYLFFTKKDTTKILFQEGESHCLKKKKNPEQQIPDMQISRLSTQVKDLVQQQLYSKCSIHLFQGLPQQKQNCLGQQWLLQGEKRPWPRHIFACSRALGGSRQPELLPAPQRSSSTCCRKSSWEGMALAILWQPW